MTGAVTGMPELHPPVPAAAPFRLRWTRAGGVLVVIGVPTVLALVVHHFASSALVTTLFHYSPDRFVGGQVWTLVLSGLLPPKLGNIGLTTILMTVVLVPYVLVRGPWRAVGRFLAGHVGATLAVAVFVLPAAALGSDGAAAVARTPDFGVSAGLAAVAGALVVVVWRRYSPLAGVLLLAAVFGFFAIHLLTTTSLGHHLSETEHLIAAGMGIVLERRSR
jgi:hypothetical protein